MRILALGDIVGKPGRRAAEHFSSKLKADGEVDFIFANAENAAAGSGLTPKIVKSLLSAGIDVLTSGDHIWKKRDIFEIIDTETRLIRPANYTSSAPGRGYTIVTVGNNRRIAVINLLGRVFMKPMESPFAAVNDILDKVKEEADIIVVDLHAEATSEKVAMGWYLDGRVTAVVGTHTHIQTSDERILPKGTAYITDLGMSGACDSVLGRSVERVLDHFITGLPARFGMAKENIQAQGIIIDVDDSNRVKSIERVRWQFHEPSSD